MENNQENSMRKRSVEVSDEEKQRILSKRKKENTNKATDLWIKALKEYMSENQMGSLDSIDNATLDIVLGKFYLEARKKTVSDPTTDDPEELAKQRNYKNTSLRAARAAFTRYFVDTRKVDIRTNEVFLESNQLFLGKTRDNKELGLGSIDNKPPITDSDFEKLANYFKTLMAGPPNPRGLLQICVFYIIYYLCRRGRENLRAMTIDTFDIAKDNDGKEYIYQKKDEADKNHGVDDTYIANQGRIYERPGESQCIQSLILTAS